MFLNTSFQIARFVISILLMALAYVLLIYFFVSDQQKKIELKNYFHANNSIPLIKITDNYDRKGYESFGELMNKPDSIVKLKKMYHDLLSSEILDFYEVSMQPVELIGEYIYSENFLYNDDINIKNQEIKSENGEIFCITPLKSIQIGRETFYKLELEKYTMNGIELKQSDFTLTNDIPVILGYNYKEYYSVGDSINALFLSQNMNFVVTGFFNKETSLLFDNNTFSLDDIFLIPLFNFEKEAMSYDENYFGIILYSIKNAGYIAYNSAEDYVRCAKEIERLAKVNQLEYTFLPDSILSMRNENGIEGYVNKNSVLALMFLNLVIFMILFFIRNDFCQGVSESISKFHGRKKMLKIKYIAQSIFIFVISLFLSYCISLYYFRYTLYLRIFMQKINMILAVIVMNLFFALIIFYIVLNIYEKKYYKTI